MKRVGEIERESGRDRERVGDREIVGDREKERVGEIIIFLNK